MNINKLLKQLEKTTKCNDKLATKLHEKLQKVFQDNIHTTPISGIIFKDETLEEHFSLKSLKQCIGNKNFYSSYWEPLNVGTFLDFLNRKLVEYSNKAFTDNTKLNIVKNYINKEIDDGEKSK